MQQVRLAFGGRNEFFHTVTEEEGTYLIIINEGGEREDGGDFGEHIPLGHIAGTEEPGTADVDQQHHGQFALFLEDLDIGSVHARGDVPVHVADVVAVLILTYFAEGHTATFERGVVLSRKYLVGETARLDLDFPDLLEELPGLVFLFRHSLY